MFMPESTIALVEVESDERRLALPLRADRRRVGTLLLPQDTPLEETGPRLVQSIGEALGWDLGVLWIVDESARALPRRRNRRRCRGGRDRRRARARGRPWRDAGRRRRRAPARRLQPHPRRIRRPPLVERTYRRGSKASRSPS